VWCAILFISSLTGVNLFHIGLRPMLKWAGLSGRNWVEYLLAECHIYFSPWQSLG